MANSVERGKGEADNGYGELGIEFGSVIDNPPAKNRRMPSFMPSSTAGPVRPATTVEAGLVTVFEGVLDTASGGDCDLSRPRFTMRSHLRLLCTYQGERLTLEKEESQHVHCNSPS